ncbi:MAG TPA: hypothetical protein VGJ71_04865 [Candidatus Limnocylindrales bacterium]|jgi:hypothetical protein
MTSIAQRLPQSIRIGIVAVASLFVSVGAVLTTPRPVLACSCAGFTSWIKTVTPETAVFAGNTGIRDERGVPVQVTHWFHGKGAAPLVWLAAESFNGNAGVSSSCGVNAPPAGSSWLWVAYPAGNGDLGTSVCSPAGDLGTSEGQTMLKEAVAAYGGDVPDPQSSTPAETAPAAPAPSPADVARDQASVAILGALLLGSLALFGGIVLIARRSGRHGPG